MAEGISAVKRPVAEAADDPRASPKHPGHLAAPVDAEKLISLSFAANEHQHSRQPEELLGSQPD